MAGSVATLAILWVSLQTMGLLGQSHTIGAYKLPVTLQNFLASYTGLPAANYAYETVVDSNPFPRQKFPRIDEASINASIQFAQSLVDRLSTLENNLVNAGIGLEARSPAQRDYLSSHPSDDAVDKGVDAIVTTKASSYLVHQHCRRFGLDKNDCARYISTFKLYGTPLAGACTALQHADCDPRSKYRSIDGSCNNVENPRWGSAMTAYTRILFPQYFDGIQEPRHIGQTKKSLPNARLVSTSLSVPNDQSDVTRTLAVMQWSQFIAHDLTQTPVRKMMSTGRAISCCRNDGKTLSPRYIHPDCSVINIPDRDPVYSEHRVRCMNYVRSLPVLRTDCTFGPVEQMNQVTHFLDGSMIYGSTLEKSRELRSFDKGLLRVQSQNGREFLPIGDDFSTYCKENCYTSGDDRVNIQPQLAVIHTLWHREHNRIAKELANLNPDWLDETLYQEARRIVIAEIQHITYKEWLPILLGKRYTRAAGLTVGHNYGRNYNSHEDPGISNEAATAAFRFVNSLMQGKLSMPDSSRQANRSIQLSEHFFKPRMIETDGAFDGLIRGLATQTSQKMDINLISDITSRLYVNNNDLGLDIVSLDIQRGRDHGLPGYNHYRKYCGLTEAKHFEDFLDYIPTEMVKKLRAAYHHPNDVDLIIGGMAERPAEDGILGPTFRCIISEQFARTRSTDRYFYDSLAQPSPFTAEQLAAVRNVTLARIFCNNGDNITHMQPNVFIRPQPGNELRPCTDFGDIPSVDLFAWAEKAKAYR